MPIALLLAMAMILLGVAGDRIERWWKMIVAGMTFLPLVLVRVATAHRDPLATSLRRFQKAASQNLCYTAIAKMEYECLGAIYSHPMDGSVPVDGKPRDYVPGSVGACRNHDCNVKAHRPVYYC